jgi:hypothetical protein
MKALEVCVILLLCFIPLGILIMWDLPGLGALAAVAILLYFLTKPEETGQAPGKLHEIGRARDGNHRRAA